MCAKSVSFDIIYSFKIKRYFSTIYDINIKNPIYPTDFVFTLNYIPGSASENVS